MIKYFHMISCLIMYLHEHKKLVQFGDVAVLDIAAVTVEQDETTAKRIPSAESKGLLLYIPILCHSSFRVAL